MRETAEKSYEATTRPQSRGIGKTVMTTQIHPTAMIDENARLADGVSIGPYSIIGAGTVLDAGVEVRSHAVIEGRTHIGSGTVIFPFASVGAIPQDKKFHGEDTGLEIGQNCVIREHVTINPGTEAGGGMTRIGDRCLLMVGAHVAHDCDIGSDVILVNNATVAGHCQVGDHAILGGLSALHQFVRIGEHAFIGGMSGVENDVIPFGSVIGNRAYLGGLNLVGLKRRGFGRPTIHALRKAYRSLFESGGTVRDNVATVASDHKDDPNVQRIVDFIRAGKDRALCTPRRRAKD